MAQDLVNPALLIGLAAIISALARLVWAFRRPTSPRRRRR